MWLCRFIKDSQRKRAVFFEHQDQESILVKTQ